MELVTKIAHENIRFLTSFDLIMKNIEEKNIFLELKQESLVRASNQFMSSTIYSGPNIVS